MTGYPSVNGIYTLASERVGGNPYYTKGEGSDARVLYWSEDGGKWCIADAIGGHERAVEPDGTSPEFKPPQVSGWLVQNQRAEEAIRGDHTFKIVSCFARIM